jgi:hypothetical protein
MMRDRGAHARWQVLTLLVAAWGVGTWWRQVVVDVEAELTRQERALDGQAPPACTEGEVLRVGGEAGTRRSQAPSVTDAVVPQSVVAPRPGR